MIAFTFRSVSASNIDMDTVKAKFGKLKEELRVSEDKNEELEQKIKELKEKCAEVNK